MPVTNPSGHEAARIARTLEQLAGWARTVDHDGADQLARQLDFVQHTAQRIARDLGSPDGLTPPPKEANR